MYGYSITINGKSPIKNGDILYKNITCSNLMIKKFEQDKVFEETQDYIIILDGVILNRNRLIYSVLHPQANTQALASENAHTQPLTNTQQSPSDTLFTTIHEQKKWMNVLLQLYKDIGERFFRVLRGSFSGALYDKKADKWIIFGDQIGSKFTYYAKVGDFFCCTEMMGYIYELMRDNNVQYHLDGLGARMLLTYGFMLDNITLCKEVKKINPGCYLIYQNGKLEEHRYYMLDNTPDLTLTEHDAIEIVDEYFRKAITSEFEKDKEYSYRHIVNLSGGLDCRMTSFVAHDCGYTDQLNITFSQSGYWDQTLPMRMAADLKHEWLFKALDNGLFLYDIEEVIKSNGGNVLFYGTAHGNSLTKYLNLREFGIVHTGQLGDVVLSSAVNSLQFEDKYQLGEGAYSTKYLDYLKEFNASYEYKNSEIGRFYYRYLNGTNNGIQMGYNSWEVLSPFLDIDFLEKALTIPVELRWNHYLYKKWILAKYPQAAEYEWETTGRRITDVLEVNRTTYKSYIPKFIKTPIKKVLKSVQEKKKPLSDEPQGMNPIDYYLAHNRDLQVFLDGYFQYVDAVPDNELRNLLIEIYQAGTAMEKIQAITLLAAIKLFYI